jgi:protein-tyrosine phosphatase
LPAPTANIAVMGFAELHFHLLPGVDDGPATIEESIALARAAADEGTRTVVATPHVMEQFVSDVGCLPERVAEVSAALRRARVPLRVLCGGELAHPMVGRLSQSELEVIAQGPPGRRWLLLEAPLAGLDEGFAEASCELRGRGFGVVIAHPERALVGSPRGWRIIEQELAAGSGLQVNAWSVAGVYGDQARDHALRAIRRCSAVALASDAHGRDRMPSLRLGLEALRALGVRRPVRLAEAVPNALLSRGLRLPARTAVV